MTEYWANRHIPPLVLRAQELANQKGFSHSCAPEVGRMLYLLAAMHPRGRLGEIGTGCGLGAAWMISAIGEAGELYTVDNDSELLESVRPAFAEFSNVHLLRGDWRALLAYGPFDLLFVDAREPKQTLPPELFEALKVGGALVVDDMTPEALKSSDQRDKPDPVRERLLNGKDLAAFEVFLPSNAAMIIAVKMIP